MFKNMVRKVIPVSDSRHSELNAIGKDWFRSFSRKKADWELFGLSFAINRGFLSKTEVYKADLAPIKPLRL
tara:strand:- start:69650 stop:69862 length:213 start_codon:yes stop_codon:yes gene_type:complete